MEALEPTTTPAATPPARTVGGLRRAAITGLLSIGLLVVGGVAVVNAADPSTSPAPTTETALGTSDDAAGSGSESDGSGRDDCPEKDGTRDDDAATS